MVCSICLEPINKETKLNCGHCFHPECIEKWFDGNDTCPYCRDPQNPTVIFHDDCKPTIITEDFIAHLFLVMTCLTGKHKILIDPAGVISIED